MSERFPRRTLVGIVAVSVVLVAAVVVWRILAGASAPVDPGTPAPADSPQAARSRPITTTPGGRAAAAADLPVHRVGMQATYDVTITSDMKFELGEAMLQRLRDVRIELAGRWTVTVVALEGDVVHLAAAMSQPRLTQEPASDGPKMAATRRDLATRHYFSMTRLGTVRETFFPKDIDPMARSLLKGVIAASQLSWPEAPAEAWQVQEQALEGEVLVAYGRAPGGGDTLEKRTVKYVRVAALGGPVPARDVGKYSINGRAELAPDPEGWLARREGRETLRVEPEGGMLNVEETRSSRFALVQRREAPELARDYTRDRPRLVAGTLVDVQRLEQDQGAIDRAWVNGASLSSLLAALRAVPAGPEGAKARAMLVPRLAALLRLEPESAAALVALARKEGDTDTSQAVLAALSSAGTPEAQAGLVDLGGDEALPKAERVRAVGLLGMSKTPNADSGNALLGWVNAGSGDLSDTAALALGNHVKRRQEGQDPDATAATTDLVEALIAKLRAAQTPDLKTLYLKALGNTGDARAVAAIIEQLATDNVSVRAAAIWALRFMTGAQVDALLVEALLKDPALAPRQAVVAGGAFRSLIPLGPALHQMARGYPDKALRLDIVHLLGISKDRYPPGIVTLKHVAANDPATDVREAAMAALKEQTVPGPTLKIKQ